MHVRLVFKDAMGVNVGTKTYSYAIEHSTEVKEVALSPTDAVAVELQWLASNPTVAGAKVALVAHVNDPCTGACYPPKNPDEWPNWPIDEGPEADPGADDEDCPTGSDDDCSCDISCDEDQELIQTCIQTSCGSYGECYCIDLLGECPQEAIGAYQL